MTVDGAFYSAPYEYVGEQVDVYVGRRIVEIYAGTKLLVTHEKASKRGERITRLEHYPEGKRAWLENPPERCLERAEAIGEACKQVIADMLADHVLDRRSGVLALLRLGEKHGNDRLEAACRRALHYGDATHRCVKNILASGLDAAPLEEHRARIVEMAEFRFVRATTAFFENGGDP